MARPRGAARPPAGVAVRAPAHAQASLERGARAPQRRGRDNYAEQEPRRHERLRPVPAAVLGRHGRGQVNGADEAVRAPASGQAGLGAQSACSAHVGPCARRPSRRRAGAAPQDRRVRAHRPPRPSLERGAPAPRSARFPSACGRPGPIGSPPFAAREWFPPSGPSIDREGRWRPAAASGAGSACSAHVGPCARPSVAHCC